MCSAGAGRGPPHAPPWLLAVGRKCSTTRETVDSELGQRVSKLQLGVTLEHQDTLSTVRVRAACSSSPFAFLLPSTFEGGLSTRKSHTLYFDTSSSSFFVCTPVCSGGGELYS
eukprot:22173-Rhodomonas_salina.1